MFDGRVWGHWTSGRNWTVHVCGAVALEVRSVYGAWHCHAPRPPRQWVRIRWRRMVTERLEEDFILELTSSRVHAFLHDQTSTIDGRRNVTLHCSGILGARCPRTVCGAKRPSDLEG